jgi:ABC-type glycerol-3-phosphate transport system substrate-binding protein
VDSGSVAPIDDIWASANLDEVVTKSIADSATRYNDKRYFIPVGYHYAGIFFNPKTMKAAGISEMPKDWDGLLAACKTLRANGVAPIALGSKSRWPAQFWFDYLLLGTAGPDYRNALVNGKASYTDAEVKRAMGMWKGLIDADCFSANSNAKEWTDAADEVARGDAAMTLMGTWITGYWNNNKLQPVQDYDFFTFPTVDANVPVSVVGPVDGFLVAANAPNPEGARRLLAFMVSDVDLQANWAKAQGALSPNTKVDPSIYNPVMKKALETVESAQNFAFNYDLATTPPVAEVGLDMFAEFINDPSSVDALLERTQAGAVEAVAQ